MPLGSDIANAARGAAIGVAEAVPGVSGGTIALVTGVYERLIDSAGHVVSGVRTAVADVPRGRGWSRTVAHLKQVHWRLVIFIAVGMLPGLLLAAKLLKPVLEEYPVQMRGLFFGLVLATLLVPASMIGRPWRRLEVVLMLVAAVAAFVLTGLPQAHVDPSPLLIFLSAAVAVCALVLPGVSGSFLLLTIGIYEPTIDAVNNRDYGYLAIFALGLIVGLALFVRLLQWLLAKHHRITLAIMTGIIAGSLRALWPWQSDARDLHAPSSDILVTFLLMVLGAAIVLGMMMLERSRVRRGAHAAGPDGPRAATREPANR